MRLTTSWYKHEMMKQNFRQAGWISLIYFLILFFAVPLNIFMQLNRAEPNSYAHYDSFFEFGVVGQVLSLFIIPVLMAMFVLRYLHQKDASDFVHGLPISRSKLFWQQAGFGIAGLWLPILSNSVLVYLIDRFFDTSVLYQEIDFGHWLMTSLLLITFVYSVGLVLGVLTGMTMIQGIFTYVILFLPVGFIFLFAYNLNFILIGFPTTTFFTDQIYKYSPITDIGDFLMPQESIISKIVVYVALTILFLILAQILYKSRPAEAATNANAFAILKPIFIYSFTFCFTLIGGLYFGSFQQNYSGIIFGYFIFSLIGYFISQMIIQKTWRIFREWKEYGIFFTGFAILLIVISFDVTGFQSRVPKMEEIESAYIVDDVYLFNNHISQSETATGFTCDEDIKMIQEYHQYLINHVTREDSINWHTDPMTIIYYLNNGKEMIREYNVPSRVIDHPFLEELKNHPIYKQYTERLFMINPSNIIDIRFLTDVSYKDLLISESSQVMEIIERLQQDILTEPAQTKGTGTRIEISYHDQQGIMSYGGNIQVDLMKEHDRVINWLIENELEDQAMIFPDDIERLVFAYSDEIQSYYDELDYYGHSFYSPMILDGLEQIQITDRDLIKEIFNEISFYHYTEEDDFLLALYLKEWEDPYVITVSKLDLSADILEQIE